MPNMPTENEKNSFNKLVDQITQLALQQCKVYSTSVPKSLSRKLEPTQRDQETLLLYHVAKQLSLLVAPTILIEGQL